MNHLTKATQLIATLSQQERVKKVLSEKWIGYTRARDILATMEDLLIHPKTHRMPNLLLVAATSNGKTILLSRFFDTHKPVIVEHTQQITLPVVYVQAPPKPEEKTFYLNILEALHAPHKVTDKPIQLYRQVAQILRSVDTKILIIDEIHHILAGPYIQQRGFLNVIKYLANDLQIVIVGAGTKDALSAINTDKQLANRFEPAILPRWKMDEEYFRLLSSFEAVLPLREPSGLANETIALKILTLSEGTIGEISSILRKAAVYAIRNNKEQIDLRIINAIDYVAPSKRQRQYESELT